MAKIVWSEPALSELDAIADYIALDNEDAGSSLVQRVFRHIDQLAKHPENGSRPPELKRIGYRQVVELPCRIFFRHDGKNVFILYVMRSERLLRKFMLSLRDKRSR